MVVGSLCYVALFLALSLFTRRALVIGIGYSLVWEGALSSLLPGIANLSVRQYALGAGDGFYQLTSGGRPTLADNRTDPVGSPDRGRARACHLAPDALRAVGLDRLIEGPRFAPRRGPGRGRAEPASAYSATGSPRMLKPPST